MTEPGESNPRMTATKASTSSTRLKLEAAEVHEPQPNGWVAQLRQIMRRSTHGRGQNQHQAAAAQRRPNKEFSIAGRAYGRARARFFAMFSTPNTPKGHRESGPSQPRPRRGAANTDTSHSVTPLLTPTHGARTTTRQPQPGGHPQYGKATHVGASQSFVWNSSGAAARGSPSGAERLRFEQDSVSCGDSRTDTTSTNSEYREAHKGVAGVRQRDVGDAWNCSRGEQCPTGSG